MSVWTIQDCVCLNNTVSVWAIQACVCLNYSRLCLSEQYCVCLSYTRLCLSELYKTVCTELYLSVNYTGFEASELYQIMCLNYRRLYLPKLKARLKYTGLKIHISININKWSLDLYFLSPFIWAQMKLKAKNINFFEWLLTSILYNPGTKLSVNIHWSR